MFSEDVEYAVIVGVSKGHICVCRLLVLWKLVNLIMRLPLVCA